MSELALDKLNWRKVGDRAWEVAEVSLPGGWALYVETLAGTPGGGERDLYHIGFGPPNGYGDVGCNVRFEYLGVEPLLAQALIFAAVEGSLGPSVGRGDRETS